MRNEMGMLETKDDFQRRMLLIKVDWLSTKFNM